jgi:DNA modification methylase
MYMRADPILWIVPASVAMAVGTTTTLLAILHHNLTLQIVDTNTILLSSTGGIAIGIIGLVMGYYYFQMKPRKIMERIFAKVKITDGSEVNQREDRKKKYYLQRISSNILRIIKNLTRLANLIDKYSDGPPPKDWQIVRYSADRSRRQTEELGKRIILDFTHIIDIVENPRLADKFGANNLYCALYLIDKTLRIDPEYDKELLRELRKELREQIGKLDGTLSLLEREKTPKDEK